MKGKRSKVSAGSPSKSKISRNVREETTSSISEIRGALRKKLSPCGVFDYKSLPTFDKHFETHWKHLHDLIERTVKNGESNSLLIVGPRGCGKTSLMRSVTHELLGEPEIEENMLVVEMNGLLHTDDSIALRDITRQLKLGNVVDDKVFGSVAEHFRFVLEAFRGGGQQCKSILFIVEEFDLFCHHKNQTLLYNIFDVAQSAQIPIAVVGLTTLLNVIELLEKRVKSRFSHRQLLLFNQLTFDRYLETAKWFLTLPNESGSDWNNQIRKLFESSVIKDVLKSRFVISKDFNTLKQLLLYPICSLSEEHLALQPSDFTDSLKLMATDSKAAILNGLSMLELTLVIAIVHYTVPRQEENFNFQTIFNEYKTLAKKKSGMKDFDKAVVMKAFEHLENLELIRPTERGVSLYQKEYIPMRLLVELAQVQESLQRYPNLPTELQQLTSAILSSLHLNTAKQ